MSRRMQYRFSHEVLREALALPSDSEIIDVRYNGFIGTIDFVVLSATHEDLMEGSHAPIASHQVIRSQPKRRPK